MERDSDNVLTSEILVSEYGFPASARLLEDAAQLMPGDYLIDPQMKHIALVGRSAYFQVHKKNMLAAKLRQQSRRRPDAARFTKIARIAPEDAPPAHQMALLPTGSLVEIPKGKFGKITDNGIAYKDGTVEFTEINAEQIFNLHPAPASAREQNKPQRMRRPAGRKNRNSAESKHE